MPADPPNWATAICPALSFRPVDLDLSAIAIGAPVAIAPRDEDQIGPVIGAKLLRVAAIAPQKQDPDILGRRGNGRGLRHRGSRQRQLPMVQAVRDAVSRRFAGIGRRRHENRDPGEQNHPRGAPPDRARSGMPDTINRDFSGHRNSPTQPGASAAARRSPRAMTAARIQQAE